MFHLNGSQGEQVTHAAAQRGARDEGQGKRQNDEGGHQATEFEYYFVR